jgi:hypothetical protein
MKMNKKLLAAVLVPLALMAVAGFGYAQWYDIVSINATATTGNFDMVVLDFGVFNQTGYSSISASGRETHTLTLTLSNTYPGWHAFVNFRWKNTGTVPIRLYAFRIYRTGGPDALMDYYYVGFCWGTYPVLAFNYGPYSLRYGFEDWRTYESAIGPDVLPYVTMAPGATLDSPVKIGLSDTLTDYESTTLTVTLELKYTIAV